MKKSRINTRYKPGGLLYTVSNGALPPPENMIPADGLPCFTSPQQMEEVLQQIHSPIPVGAYISSNNTNVGLHDSLEFLPSDFVRYKGSGYHMVELPSGELRLLDRNVLKSLNHDSNIGLEPLSRSLRRELQKGFDPEIKDAILRSHILKKHPFIRASDPDDKIKAHFSEHEKECDHSHKNGFMKNRFKKSLVVKRNRS